MVAKFGKPYGSRWYRAFAVALLGVFAAGVFGSASAQTSMEKHRARRANSPFNLNAGPNAVLEANLVQCGIDNQGNVCTNIFNSPTGGGGFWPSGTTNQYIFNSGLQIAGINSAQAGPWSNDTVGAYFFDARGTQPHGTNLTDVFNSLNANDLANWPAAATVSDTSIFNAALIGSRVVSDQDSYVQYWDGDPNRISQRSHPMGIKVEQRSMAFNAPAGAEHTVFFIYKFTNVTNDPAFQTPNEAKCTSGGGTAAACQLPDAGWTINNIYAAFAMDPDVTTHAGDNFATGILPFQMGIAYHARFETDDFNYAARSDLYAPPFFQGPGFVGVKYLKSPVNPATGQQVGLTMFSNTTNGGTFPDPIGVKQLFRYLKGDVSTAAGDPTCTIANSIANRLCALVQDPADARFYQASGPFSLRAGESSTIVVAYTHGPPMRVAEYTVGDVLRPGIPAVAPGTGGVAIRTVEKMAGLLNVPASAVTTDAAGNNTIDQSRLVVGRDVAPRSLLANALIAQSIFNNKFLLPRPPEAPTFTLVPGNNQVTVIWEPSRTDVGCTATTGGDPYFSIASNTASPLYNPNYRRCDVEGYRVYRATGLSGGFELIGQFDKTGTVFTDITGELDPAFVPEEGQPYGTPVPHPLTGAITQYPAGARIRDAVTGSVIVTNSSTITLEDTGVPFVFTDRSVRNGITYRYIVTAFDVNSLASGAVSLESPRQPQFTVPRSTGLAGEDADVTVELRGRTRALNPAAAAPTIDGSGRFSGPPTPTDALRAGELQLALGNALRAGQINVVKIDSVIAHASYGAIYYVTVGQNQKLTIRRDEFCTVRQNPSCGAVEELAEGIVTIPADTTALAGQFANTPKFAGAVPFELVIGRIPRHSFIADWAGDQPQFFTSATIPPGGNVGGSRWFEGANETLANPTLGNAHGGLAGITQIGAFTPYNSGIGAIGRRFHQAVMGIVRDAEFEVVWSGGRVTAVNDVTHDVAVAFDVRPQATYGFLQDGDGNGRLNYDDVRYLRFTDSFGGFKATPDRDLVNQPVILPTDGLNQDGAADGNGFAMYINGEVFYFVGAAPTGNATWKLRTHFGAVTRSGTTYSYAAEANKPPAVPGLTLVVNVNAAAALETRTDLKSVHTVPDPYYVRSAFELGPSNKALRFVNLPQQAVVRIYSLNGTLVRVLTHNDIQGGGELSWDLRNRNNQFVASGVYFFHVEAPNGDTHTGRFTVVQFAR